MARSRAGRLTTVARTLSRGPVALDLAHLGVILAGEDSSAGLNLGDAGDVGGVLVRARAAGRDDPARVAGGSTSVASLEQLGDRRSDGRALFGRVGDHQGVALVAHQSIEPQARAGRNLPGEGDRFAAVGTPVRFMPRSTSTSTPIVTSAADAARLNSATWSGWSTVTLTSACF